MIFSRRETALLVIGDFIVLVASLWLALAARALSVPTALYFTQLFVPFIPIFLMSLIVFYVAGLYEKQTMPVRRVMGERIAGAQVANTVLAALFFFVLQLSIAPKTILALYLVISVVAVSLWRFYRMSRETRLESRVPAVLVGHGAAVDEVFEELSHNDRQLLRVAARVDTATVIQPDALVAAVTGAFVGGAQVVILDSHDPLIARVLATLFDSVLWRATYVEFAALYEQLFDRVPLKHIDYTWLLSHVPDGASVYDIVKRAFDMVVAAFGLIVALPFVLPAALLLRMHGSAFIHNERVGQGGRTFRMLKLRTMLFDDRGDPTLRAKNRITKLGNFLRKSRIDELPQLWNVFRGDASFIGPRPELPALVAVYEREIPFYHARHRIKPGLSGWAQLRDNDPPKGGVDVERTRTKLSYDLYYLKHRSFGLDLSIMLKTLRALAAFSGK